MDTYEFAAMIPLFIRTPETPGDFETAYSPLSFGLFSEALEMERRTFEYQVWG
jgi:hypothetical protein